MTDTAGVFARYPRTALDEAVAPDGALRSGYAPIARVLDECGRVGIAAVAGAMAEERAAALPPKLTLPLGLLVFPVVLIVVLAPAVMRIAHVVGP